MELMELFSFQKIGAEFLAGKTEALLASEQGTGKTIMAIEACNYLGARSILIVCKAGLKLNWEIELKRWLRDPRLKIKVVHGTQDTIRLDHDIVIVNYDLLAISDGIYQQVVKRKWAVGVFDEAHFLKGRTSKRTKAILLKNGVASRCLYKWFMTGTPVLNRPEELYPMLKACAPKVIAPYTTFETFAKHFCAAWWDGFQLVTKGSSNETELNIRLQGFMLRQLKKDVLAELPDKTYQLISVPPQTAEIKKLVAEEFFWSKQEARKISNVSSGNDISILRHQLGLSKVIKAVAHAKDMLEETPKIIIFAYHRDVIAGLSSGLADYLPCVITGSTGNLQRQIEVESFQKDPNRRVFIGQIEAAGDGITLTAASVVLFVEGAWTPGYLNQAMDRAHRIGQTKGVVVQFLVIEDSLDEHQLRIVIDKKETIEKIVDGDKTAGSPVAELFQ